MRLFADFERTGLDPAGHAEPHYEYINRSGRPAFGAVRDLLEQWLNEYPQYHRKELIARLRTNDDLQFEAAFFELYLHHLLRCARARVRVHPYRGKGRRRPDFHVTPPTGAGFWAEAVTVTEGSAMDRTAAGRLSVLYDALNRAKSPEYFFHVRHFGLPKSPLPGRRIRDSVERWLSSLDYDEVRNAAAHPTLEGPTLAFEHDGCRLEITLFPVSGSRRGSADHRPIGMLGGEARMVDHWTPMRDGIKAKASRYGRLRQPYLVAVNALDQPADQIDVMQALFGQESYGIARIAGSQSEPRLERLRNGAWVGPKGPVNSRVSGVLVVGSLLPWTVAVHRPTLYHNPWAAFPLVGPIPGLDEQRPVGNQMVAHNGRPMPTAGFVAARVTSAA